MRFQPASMNSAGARRGRALAAILVTYVGLALLYNAATPIFEASDEFRHFLALHSMVETHRLPILAPSNDPLTPGVEAGQPPLYYLLAGALSGWVDVGTLPGLDFNPHVQEGIPSTDPDNKNLFVHSVVENFPYRGLSLAVHLERLLSVLLGAGTVWLTYRLAKVVAPSWPAVPLLAAALVGFNPQFLFISTSVDNDNLIILASTAALLVMALVLRTGLTSRRLWLLSALLGVAMLSKLSGLALPLLAAVVVAKATGNRQDVREGIIGDRQAPGLVASVLVLAAGPLLMTGWWYVRNWLTYGDPTGLSAWIQLYGGERGGRFLGLLREAPGLFISYWGVFGGFDLKADDWLYLIYLALTVAGIAGMLVAWRRVGQVTGSWAPVWLLAGWFGLELAALARWTSITSASTGRLLFPAIGAAAVLLAMGLLAPLAEPARPWAVGGIGIVLAGLAVFVPVRYLLPAYRPPLIAQSASAVGVPTHPVRITYGDTFELLGYDVSASRAQPGEEVETDLYWHVLKPPDRNYAVTMQLLSGEGALGQYDSLPGEGKIATRRLAAGDYYRDRYRVRVKTAAPAPIIARLMIAMYDDQLARLPAHSSSGGELNEPVIAELAVDPVSAAPAPGALANLGQQMELLSDRIPEQAVRPGASFEVDFRWRAAERMSRDYTVFVHLVDDAGRLVAQQDQQPRGGAFPTRWWAAGEIVDDTLELTVPPGTRPGRYQLLLGAYELGSLQRLQASTGGDTFELGGIEVG